MLECQPALQEILATVAGIDQLVVPGDRLPPFDVQIPLMSLASVLGTTLETIPGPYPYLRPDTEHHRHWRGLLSTLPGFKIGIVWQGNKAQSDDRYRSVPLSQFAPLARIPGVKLFGLQVGPGHEQLADALFPVTDLGSRFDPASLSDLAAVLPNLDLVVTVCSAVAHLAGTLGLPAWVALRHVPYWCWSLAGTASPWYPTLRLFRQSRPCDWDAVFESIAAAVRQKLATEHNRLGLCSLPSASSFRRPKPFGKQRV